jgi:threonine/homoserine/homoserine lactone efflux protein
MEETSLFFVKGLLLGALLAAPVGERGAALLSRSRYDGFAAGIGAALGGALADLLYAGIAGYLVAGVLGDWIAENDWIRQFGAMMLLWLGWQAYNAPLIAPERAASRISVLQALANAFMPVAANPTGLVAFATVFMALGVDRGGPDAAANLALGVFLGAVGWGIALAASQASVDATGQRAINRTAAVLLALAAFAVAGGFV